MFIRVTIIREGIKEPSLQQIEPINRFYRDPDDGRTYLEYKEKDEDGFNLRDLVKEGPTELIESLIEANLYIKKK